MTKSALEERLSDAELAEILRESADYPRGFVVMARELQDLRRLSSERDEMERTLREIKELAKGPLPWTPAQSRKNRGTIFSLAALALSKPQEGGER